MSLYLKVKEDFIEKVTNHPILQIHQNDIIEAFSFGELKHQGQTRKHSQEPYFIHCTGVALALLDEPDVTKDNVISALLHDTLEDTETTFDELKTKFGEYVSLIVKALSKLPVSYKESMGTERYYNEGFFGPINTLAKIYPFVWKIKLSDRLNNLETYYKFSSPEKIKEYVWETHQILKYTTGMKTPLIDKIKMILADHYI